MRKNRTIIYSFGVLILILIIGYLNGYRLSLTQINTELNQRMHFNPANIIYSKTNNDTAIVVSENNHWIVCRQIKGYFGVIWKYNNQALDPLKINSHSETYAVVLNNYIKQCESITLVKEITINNPNINITMQNYLNQESIGSAQGKVFGVKIIRLVKIVNNSIQNQEPIKYYYYDLVIAPITNQLPIQLKNVVVYPSGKATEYFKNKNGEGYATPDDFQNFITSTRFNKWTKIQALYAYEYSLIYSNLSDRIQEQRKVSTSELDDGMATIDVTISFNNTSETIRVNLDAPMVTITASTDPLLDVDSNLKGIYESSSFGSEFVPFHATKPLQK